MNSEEILLNYFRFRCNCFPTYTPPSRTPSLSVETLVLIINTVRVYSSGLFMNSFMCCEKGNILLTKQIWDNLSSAISNRRRGGWKLTDKSLIMRHFLTFSKNSGSMFEIVSTNSLVFEYRRAFPMHKQTHMYL